jgi:hypothetical protein
MPPLEKHVTHVVQKRAEEEMLRVHANPHIAPMQDIETVGDMPIRNFPRDPMGVE